MKEFTDIRAIAKALVVLAKANQIDPKNVFGKTPDMLALAAAYENHREKRLREAAKTLKTWTQFSPKEQKTYAGLFLIWKTIN